VVRTGMARGDWDDVLAAVRERLDAIALANTHNPSWRTFSYRFEAHKNPTKAWMVLEIDDEELVTPLSF